jgi:hypothetical protein
MPMMVWWKSSMGCWFGALAKALHDLGLCRRWLCRWALFPILEKFLEAPFLSILQSCLMCWSSIYLYG